MTYLTNRGNFMMNWLSRHRGQHHLKTPSMCIIIVFKRIWLSICGLTLKTTSPWPSPHHLFIFICLPTMLFICLWTILIYLNVHYIIISYSNWSNLFKMGKKWLARPKWGATLDAPPNPNGSWEDSAPAFVRGPTQRTKTDIFGVCNESAQWKCSKIAVETDAQMPVRAIQTADYAVAPNGVLFREIKALAFLKFISSFSIIYCPRACNKVFDALAS
jgi:hypothetical protein